jgi:hypothetical protein
MKEPVDHIERPTLPWRNQASLTECGLAAVQVRAITRTDFDRRIKEWGEQRTAITTCMTCYNTARRWGTWQDDPRKAIEREVNWETGYGFGPSPHGTQLRDELKAIALLIERHRSEFKELVHDVVGTVDFLAERRKRTRE